jgi:VIT1/CCC1 family predicted Fe2+/Mn2+ transporter
MVLTVTFGARLVAAQGQLNVHQLMVTVVGCNIAWGVIDAVFFVFGNQFHRSQRARFYRALKTARNEAEALAAIEEEYDLEDEPLASRFEDRARLYQSMLAVSAHAAPARARLRMRDFSSALVVFVLVSAAALPGLIPFLLFEDSDLVLHLSNLVMILLLFVVGYWWGHYTDTRPWRVGLIVMLLGLSLVLVAIALGG